MEKGQHTNSRRRFLKKSLVFVSVAAAAPGVLSGMPNSVSSNAGQGCTFLFQGDSITDGNRTRNNDWNHVLGHGYQFILASKIWYEHPQKEFHFFNRGVSGNKVTDLAARWQKDTLDIKPDVLSILIGINDTSAYINGNNDYSSENYESGYNALLEKTKQELPNVRLILCEPFILPVGKVKDKWDDYKRELEKRQAAVKRLSKLHNTIFVPFQQAFNDALSKAPANFWIWDGIHPMPAGHELMARTWMHHVSKKLKFIK